MKMKTQGQKYAAKAENTQQREGDIMKYLRRLKWALVMAAVTVLMAVLPAQAEGMKEQEPITLTIEGVRNGKVWAGAPLTFRAKGGSGGGAYYLIIEVDGNRASYPMSEKGYLQLSTGILESSHTALPVGVHYEVRAARAAGIGYEIGYSDSDEFEVIYDEPGYYRLETYTSKQFDINYWAGQYALSEIPKLYRKSGDQWVEFMSPLDHGAVFRYDIRDASGKVVSMSGLVKGCGRYTVTAYELLTDPVTGKTVKVTADPVETVIADINTVDPGTIDPDVLDDLYDDMGDLSGSLGDLGGNLGDLAGTLGGLVDDVVNGPGMFGDGETGETQEAQETEEARETEKIRETEKASETEKAAETEKAVEREMAPETELTVTDTVAAAVYSSQGAADGAAAYSAAKAGETAAGSSAGVSAAAADGNQSATAAAQAETATEKAAKAQKASAQTETGAEKAAKVQKTSVSGKTAKTQKASASGKTAKTQKASASAKTAETQKASASTKTAKTQKASASAKTVKSQKTSAASKAAKPGKTKITSLTNKKGKKAVLKFKAVKGAAGYEIVYGTSKSLKKNTKKIFTKKTGATLKKLAKKKTCYVKVRAYKVNAAGKKVYGDYSAAAKVKIRK